MDFRIADTFTDSLARLPAAEQKAAKLSVMDLQLDPTGPGLQLHRIDKSKDPNFWSARVSRDLRLVLHKTGSSLLIAYVGHHDDAYAWAQRRRIEAHPKTGAVQIVELRERTEDSGLRFMYRRVEAPETFAEAAEEAPPFEHRPIGDDRFNRRNARAEVPLFDRLAPDDLLSVGVPEDWVHAVGRSTEADFYDLADHLPEEAAEALLEYAATGRLRWSEPSAPPIADPYEHPDSRRRFATFDNAEELALALDAPWDRWSIFLHPSQQAAVERRYSGAARVAGTAGTGKTVVALHRAARLVRGDSAARVLLSTFSDPLAASLEAKLRLLLGQDAVRASRIFVASFEALAAELFQLAFGRKPRMATDERVGAALADAAQVNALTGFSQRFLMAEWTHVIDAWRVADAAAYANVPRLGRRNRLGSRQRAALWPVFEAAAASLKGQGYVTSAGIFHALADHYDRQATKPFSHIVVDEAQDLGVPELRLMAALTAGGEDALFFAGDLGQRIFQQPFSWLALGVDVRGRSATLKVNYRTSRQIRETADRLMPQTVRDVDGREEDRRGTIWFSRAPRRKSSWPTTTPMNPREWRAFSPKRDRMGWRHRRWPSSSARGAS